MSSGTGKKIMIVDDSQAITMVLKRILEEKGFSIVGSVTTGEEALDKYDQLKPDLVTMDLILPGMSGIETIKELLKIDPQARIVVVSSVGSSVQKLTEALEVGALNIISKPFDSEKVIEVIKQALET